VFNPFFSLIYSLVVSIYLKNINILIFNISLFFGLLNATKVIDSDLIAYHYYFTTLSQLDIDKYFDNFSTEYLYYFITYISSHLINWEIFITLLTFISFMLIFHSIKIVLEYKKADFVSSILTILVFASFYLYFSHSAHLLRNFISACLIFYFVVNLIFKNKNYYGLLLSSILIHSSAVVGFLIYYKKLFSFKLISVAKYSLISVILFFTIDYYFNVINYITYRISNFENFSLINITITNFILGLLIFILTILLSSKFVDKYNMRIEAKYYLQFYIIILILGLVLYPIDIIKARILFYLYFISIPLYILIFINNKIIYWTVTFTLFLLNIYMFYKNFYFGPWKYTIANSITTANIHDYLNLKLF
jgi:hypothetical protein